MVSSLLASTCKRTLLALPKRMVSTSVFAQSSQTVTLPHIPELFDPNFLDVLVPPKSPITGPQRPAQVKQIPENPMMAGLASYADSNRTYTENGAQALNSTGSATLDAFNGLSRWSFSPVVEALLGNAWNEDPELALRIIWNTRSIHDGKGEKEVFYRAFGWLYDNHPRTALVNLPMLVSRACTSPKSAATSKEGRPHGYWKDLLNILALATCDQLSGLTRASTFLHNYLQPISSSRRYSDPLHKMTPPSAEKIRQKRKELYDQFYERLVKKLRDDPKYRALYISVTRLFAEQIRKDLAILREVESFDTTNLADDKELRDRYWALLKSISLVGKWAPSPNKSHDRVTNISTAICQLLFSEPLPDGFVLPASAQQPDPSSALNCHTLRSYYQRWILRPLRSLISCPEPLMSANQWSSIKYNRVPSLCMSRNKEHFFRHDPEGFQSYLLDVEKGKKKISGATLMPHELVGEALQLQAAMEGVPPTAEKYPKLAEYKRQFAESQIKVINAQWLALVDRLREHGKLDNALAICDVSGSMGTAEYYNRKYPQPIHAALALSLIVANLAKPPFDQGFITFSSSPEFIKLNRNGVPLAERLLGEVLGEMNQTEWAMTTDFEAVFVKLLLPIAKKNHVKNEDMIKRLFVFSDMQFDAASNGDTYSVEQSVMKDSWDTTWDRIEVAYREAGYDVPQVVFWNLTGGHTAQVTVEVEAERKGVAMMSGFSGAMVKVFMGEEEEEEEEWMEVGETGETKAEKEFNPINVMKKALMRESFNGLVVVD